MIRVYGDDDLVTFLTQALGKCRFTDREAMAHVKKKENFDQPKMTDEKVVESCRQTKLSAQIVVSSKPLKVAKAWVRNMTGGADSDSDLEDSPTKELESRPPRLGLGAKFIPHSELAMTINPIERKLRTMTNTVKHRAGEGTSNLARSGGSRKQSKPDTSSKSSEEDEEDEVKGSRNGRLQRRIASADLLMKSVSSKDRKRKR